MEIFQWKIENQIDSIFVIASAKGVKGIYWKRQDVPLLKQLSGDEPHIQILQAAESQLNEYFRGKLKKFDLPLDLVGTDFQKKVWQELLRIPFGKTCSYKELAVRIGNPLAVRAVGTANGRNPISVVIPCHRVIASDGSLAGYSGGVDKKMKLLEIEK